MSFSLSMVIQAYRGQIAAATTVEELDAVVQRITGTFQQPYPTRSYDEEANHFIGSENRMDQDYARLMLRVSERWDEVAD